MVAALAARPAGRKFTGWTADLRARYEDWQTPRPTPGAVKMENVIRWLSDTLPENGEAIPAGLRIDSKMLARLAKLTRPHRRPAERVLGFDLSATTVGVRPNVRATADGYDVLICPMSKRA